MSSRLNLGVNSRVKRWLSWDMAERLSIGAVAAKTGLSADTIRYYERVGLLPKPARTAAGYRQYSEGVVNRLALIRSAQRFGFSLREIAGFLRVREAGGKPCHDVRSAAQRILNAIDAQVDELIAARRRMRDTLRTWDRKLAATRDSEPAYLLEMLGASDCTRESASRLFVRTSPGRSINERRARTP